MAPTRASWSRKKARFFASSRPLFRRDSTSPGVVSGAGTVQLRSVPNTRQSSSEGMKPVQWAFLAFCAPARMPGMSKREGASFHHQLPLAR